MSESRWYDWVVGLFWLLLFYVPAFIILAGVLWITLGK